jgi:amino acid adenylation domain-containing protein
MNTSTLELPVRSLPELFSRSVARWPERPAVIDGEQVISYAALDEASSKLAGRLRALGVGPGDLVGLLLERSAGIPVAILATLKAGAAYVPLDPGYPPERLRYLATDAQVSVIVGDQDLVSHADLLRIPFVDALALPDEASGPLPSPPAGTDPAYVIYTSGSTGNPKGCVISHRNVLALLRAAVPLFDVSPADRWALFHSFSFDVSVWELWAALSTGGATVTVPLRAAQSAPDLLDLIGRQRITVLGQVPSVFRPLAMAHADAGWPELPLRYLVFAGEPVDLAVIRDFLDGCPGTPPTAVNMYGPTETTVYATHQVLTRAFLSGSAKSPIGPSLPHLNIEIRDEQGAVRPDGETGEMWISGEGVCDGYLNRPDLTAERFVTVSGPDGTARYYRTGDLARKLPSGTLDYLGRRDGQIKLRGYRIELGEVETALRSHSSVRDAAVTVVSTPAGARFLVAGVVLGAPAPERPAAGLRQYLTGILPRYMVPDRYQVLDDLPRTGSGKLDRQALTALVTPGPRRTP